MKKNFPLKNKNVLVTGGAGFIGSHLVEKLLEIKARVIVVDIEIRPHSIFVLDGLYKKVALELIDICDREKVFKVFNEYKPDFVFHLAAYAVVPSAFNNPYDVIETNVMGTVNILEAARQNQCVKGLIVASSDKAYGKLAKGKYKETDALKGDHPYEVSKSCTDLICQTYFKTYGLPVIVTRFGNVYGEGDFHFDRIIPGICEAIIKKKTLEIRSNGKYVRDYLYVKDVVDGYILLLDNFAKVKGEAFNFGSKETLSVIDLISRVEKALKVKINYKILNSAQNEIPYQSLDYSKIRKTLGWEPKQTVEKTIEKIYLWYRYNFF